MKRLFTLFSSLLPIAAVLSLLSCSSQAQGETNVNLQMAQDTVKYTDLRKQQGPDPQLIVYFLGDELFNGVAIESWTNGGSFVFDIENGLQTKQVGYYKNGQIERHFESINGLSHGKSVMFFENGNPYIEQYYDHGKPIGMWKRWDSEGNLVEEFDPNKKEKGC